VGQEGRAVHGGPAARGQVGAAAGAPVGRLPQFLAHRQEDLVKETASPFGDALQFLHVLGVDGAGVGQAEPGLMESVFPGDPARDFPAQVLQPTPDMRPPGLANLPPYLPVGAANGEDGYRGSLHHRFR
jgi:hypothetical protein